jgi:restriction system protein
MDLVRTFLIEGGSLGCDDAAYFYLIELKTTDKEQFRKAMTLEHYRRLYKEYPELIKGKTPMIWQGNTWILDLLPEKPQLALDVLHAYLVAHLWVLPDGRIDGLKDAMTLIRAKFIETPQSSLLSSINPFQFEHLVDALYTIMGFTTTLTQRTYDRGRDIIAEKRHSGEKQRLLIQCKRTQKNVESKSR